MALAQFSSLFFQCSPRMPSRPRWRTTRLRTRRRRPRPRLRKFFSLWGFEDVLFCSPGNETWCWFRLLHQNQIIVMIFLVVQEKYTQSSCWTIVLYKKIVLLEFAKAWKMSNLFIYGNMSFNILAVILVSVENKLVILHLRFIWLWRLLGKTLMLKWMVELELTSSSGAFTI